MPRIFFSSTLTTPFIEEDAIILQRHFAVEKLIARGIRAFPKISAAVSRSDVTFSWFGSVYAAYTVFLARVLGKKSIIVAGGVDASREPEINYGIWLNPWKARLVRYAFLHADRVLVVDPALEVSLRRLAEYGGENIRYAPTGYDGSRWTPGDRKEDVVVTVAACDNIRRMKTKGLDKLFEAARNLPAVRFRVIGIHEAFRRVILPDLPHNVEVIPFIAREEVLTHLQRAKVYCQPSFTEGLPNALCEAMLCGCIPVGTLRGGIPSAIGNAGYLVPYGDVHALVTAIRSAMQAPPEKGKEARERILREFPLERRERDLVETVNELMP